VNIYDGFLINTIATSGFAVRETVALFVAFVDAPFCCRVFLIPGIIPMYIGTGLPIYCTYGARKQEIKSPANQAESLSATAQGSAL